MTNKIATQESPDSATQAHSKVSTPEQSLAGDPTAQNMPASWLFNQVSQHAASPFTVEFWDGQKYQLGSVGDPEFCLKIVRKEGLAALQSLDELRICEAYMAGDLDFDGDMLKLFDLQRAVSTSHPIFNFIRWVRPKLFGQLRGDKQAISTHYDYDHDFYLSFLDETRAYSQGVFEADDEPLDVAMRRKLDFAIASCQLKPGMRVLDVGGGWGSFTEYAGQQGIEVTSLTISKQSFHYISNLIEQKNLPCKVIQQHFFEHSPEEKYDAVVILGVMEHLPEYHRVIKQLQKVLRLDGRAYLDASADTEQFSTLFSPFMSRYIFPGNHCLLSIHDFIAAVQPSNLELLSVHNDRHSYYLTLKAWASNLEAAKAKILERWGRELYCKFHLYFWGACHNLLKNEIQAYRVVLQHNPVG